MSSSKKINSNINAITRILKRDVPEIQKSIIESNNLDNAYIYLDEENLLHLYFLIHGLDGDYKGGEYIGKFIFDNNYPLSPPEFIMITPNGRFDVRGKICMTYTKYHPDSWNSTYTFGTIIIGILSAFTGDKDTGIGHLLPRGKRDSNNYLIADRNEPLNIEFFEMRKKYAKESLKYNLTHHKELYNNLKENHIRPNLKKGETIEGLRKEFIARQLKEHAEDKKMAAIDDDEDEDNDFNEIAKQKKRKDKKKSDKGENKDEDDEENNEDNHSNKLKDSAKIKKKANKVRDDVSDEEFEIKSKKKSKEDDNNESKTDNKKKKKKNTFYDD